MVEAFIAKGVRMEATTSSSLNPTFLLLGGAVFAVICAFVAQSKGRSVALWAILGFFLGLIALIIIALMKKQPTVAGNPMSPPPPPPMSPPPAIPPPPPTDQTGE